MKKYIKPAIDIYDVIAEQEILTLSVRQIDVDDEGIDEIEE